MGKIQERLMDIMSIKRLGFALGASSALLYLGCAFVMMTVPPDAAVRFFNSITHGVDWGPIMRWDMPWWEMVVGVLQVFILGWLFGALIAAFYNSGLNGKKP
jgi:protein-S-isoprenylcysteine O-methyltransferase Ste14